MRSLCIRRMPHGEYGTIVIDMKSEKKKVLSEAEKKRLERYEKLSADLARQGYSRNELTINIVKANLFAVMLLIPLIIAGYGLYFCVNHEIGFPDNFVKILIEIIILIIAHELIHGFCWSLFTPGRFRDIEFGIMKPSMSPYCTCLVPLSKGQHIFGTVMPLILLGIIPMIAGILLGNPDLLFIGIIMADSAAGDILIVFRVLGHKSSAEDIVYMDHPTEAGGVIFEK